MATATRAKFPVVIICILAAPLPFDVTMAPGTSSLNKKRDREDRIQDVPVDAHVETMWAYLRRAAQH